MDYDSISEILKEGNNESCKKLVYFHCITKEIVNYSRLMTLEPSTLDY